ncbi:unnamed protein product [Mytilus edulis]|uniref:Uncharacterized protein n=1 Tax=Mytilus edulis TaxID=6550 RepID=A0A8S3RNF7_MYTED|nr:unnamed protein product [Mytilus edulis]
MSARNTFTAWTISERNTYAEYTKCEKNTFAKCTMSERNTYAEYMIIKRNTYVDCTYGETPYHLAAKDRGDDDDFEKFMKKQVMDYLKTFMSKEDQEVTTRVLKDKGTTPVVEDFIKKKEQSVMLNRLLGQGTYDSFDMRCMVTGQFGVGKSTLVKLLIGDAIPDERLATDGISLLEGRCGLDIDTREWVLIDPETYNALDVVYNKVLMTSVAEDESKQDEIQEAGRTSGKHAGDVSQQSKASNVHPTKEQSKKKMKTKMTKDEIRKKMEEILRSGNYKIKVGRLIFWDFGGQYVYYTTHQTFMTFRALFLLVFDGSKGLHDQVLDVLCFPGQHMIPTPADKQFWPSNVTVQAIFKKMSESGSIQKGELYQIWEQEAFSKVLPYKKYIFDMLIHLDIVSEQRRYNTKTGRRQSGINFFVPCMVTARNTTKFMTEECTPKRAIGLAFTFKGAIIPPALPNRLFSACLNMWNVKTYKEQKGKGTTGEKKEIKLLFSGFLGLSYDKVHDVVVCVQANRIHLYIVHKTSNDLIVSDIATSIKESFYITLERIIEFYQSTVHARASSLNKPFQIEYSCSELECFITEEEALQRDEWVCEKHKLVHKRHHWNVWNQDQKAFALRKEKHEHNLAIQNV